MLKKKNINYMHSGRFTYCYAFFKNNYTIGAYAKFEAYIKAFAKVIFTGNDNQLNK